MNGDGIRDIVSGSWPGEIYLIPGRKDGSFGAPETLKDRDGNAIKPGNASVVVLNDWDRDGDLDITAGTIGGDVLFYANDDGGFGEGVALKANGKHISAHHGGPALADWDGNGTVDLLLGDGDGKVHFYPNNSKKGMPNLGEGVLLVGQTDGVNSAPGYRTKLDVADWNGDGKLDLLLGDFVSEEGEAPEFTNAELEEKAAAEKALEPLWEEYNPHEVKMRQNCLKQLGVNSIDEIRGNRELIKKYGELEAKARKESDEGKAMIALRERMDPYYEILSKFRTPQILSGKVWVFLRKN